jgi:hypothetical protein
MHSFLPSVRATVLPGKLVCEAARGYARNLPASVRMLLTKGSAIGVRQQAAPAVERLEREPTR